MKRYLQNNIVLQFSHLHQLHNQSPTDIHNLYYYRKNYQYLNSYNHHSTLLKNIDNKLICKCRLGSIAKH